MNETWITLAILSAGIVVVVGGVLLFRLHAFLALVLGACVVSAFTPAESIERYALQRDGFRVVASAEYQKIVRTVAGREEAFIPAKTQILLHLRSGQFAEPNLTCRLYWLSPQSADTADEAGAAKNTGVLVRIVEVISGVRKSGVTDRLALAEPIATPLTNRTKKPVPGNETPLSGDSAAGKNGAIGKNGAAGMVAVPLAAAQSARRLAYQKTFAARVTEGFGNTCTKIGVLIALASIIGMCLLESGAADRIVRTTLKRLGEKGAPVSFLTSGFLLGIPVFFDTVFYLMIPLGKAMRMRTGRNYLLYVLTIVAGATMAHSLVPPTPGPLFVAEQLGVDLGLMILAGCGVGLFTVIVGYGYAHLVNRRWELPLRESPEFSLQDLEEITRREESELPGFCESLLPIVLPVILIGGYTVLKRLGGLPGGMMQTAAILGDKNVALGISAAVALGTLIRQKKANLKELGGSIQSSLASGGVIILITAAGGAFGAVLQQTGVSGLIRDLPRVSPVMIVGLAFLITTAIRTAQGSATVAMITAVGILSGLATSGELGFHPVYLALAIGCGSKPVGWMNDSGFWVITKMSGMTEAEGLKYVTPMTALMGVVGLAVVMLAVTFFPLV